MTQGSASLRPGLSNLAPLGLPCSIAEQKPDTLGRACPALRSRAEPGNEKRGSAPTSTVPAPSPGLQMLLQPGVHEQPGVGLARMSLAMHVKGEILRLPLQLVHVHDLQVHEDPLTLGQRVAVVQS